MISSIINNPTILAASTEAQNFTKVSMASLFVAGLFFFFFGLILGWLIWRHYRSRALQIEEENRNLRAAQERREKSFQGHRTRFSH